MTRVAVREIRESIAWALRASGVAAGDAALAADSATTAELAAGAGIASAADALRCLDAVGVATLSIGGCVVTADRAASVLTVGPRAALAVAGADDVTALQLRAVEWTPGFVGALIAASADGVSPLVAVGYASSGSAIGWAAATSAGIWVAHDAPDFDVTDPDREEAATVVVEVARAPIDIAPTATWRQLQECRDAALRDGVDLDDDAWSQIARRAYGFLVPER